MNEILFVTVVPKCLNCAMMIMNGTVERMVKIVAYFKVLSGIREERWVVGNYENIGQDKRRCGRD